jgi:hypothetical protein
MHSKQAMSVGEYISGFRKEMDILKEMERERVEEGVGFSYHLGLLSTYLFTYLFVGLLFGVIIFAMASCLLGVSDSPYHQN